MIIVVASIAVAGFCCHHHQHHHYHDDRCCGLLLLLLVSPLVVCRVMIFLHHIWIFYPNVTKRHFSVRLQCCCRCLCFNLVILSHFFSSLLLMSICFIYFSIFLLFLFIHVRFGLGYNVLFDCMCSSQVILMFFFPIQLRELFNGLLQWPYYVMTLYRIWYIPILCVFDPHTHSLNLFLYSSFTWRWSFPLSHTYHSQCV